MSESTGASLDRLAEEFVRNYRAGSYESLTDVANKHPELKQKILGLFPVLIALEDLAPVESGAARVLNELVDQTSFGDYEIVREIGRGGMGVVFLARQQRLQRHVALKVMQRRLLTDADARDRFLRESRAAANLQHPHIVPVFDVGEQDQFLYYSMQLISGCSLADALEERRRLWLDGEPPTTASPNVDGGAPATARSDGACDPPAVNSAEEGRGSAGTPSILTPMRGIEYCNAIARLGVQIAEALACAHVRGVVHRDVKPSNILVDREGNGWLTDFGLAKIASQRKLSSHSGIFGTLRYSPPEQLHGKADERSDIYSLGLTLYDSVILKRATEEHGRAGIAHGTPNAYPGPPCDSSRIIPDGLETIILKATEEDPRDRYQSAREFADDLCRFLSGQSIRARRHSSIRSLSRWPRRHLAVSSLALVVAALAVLVAVMLPHYFARDDSRIDPASVTARPPDVNDTSTDRHRLVAHRVLSHGGRILVMASGDEIPLSSAEELPRQPFEIVQIDVTGIRAFDDTCLEGMSQLSTLDEIILSQSSVGDKGVKELQGLQPTSLLLGFAGKITDESMDVIATFTHLRRLGLNDSRISDDGLKQLNNHPHLLGLTLYQCPITDAGLDYLGDLKSLRLLDVRQTQVSAAGVHRLQQRLPMCDIQYLGD